MLDMSAGMLLSGLLIGGVGAFLFFRGRRESEPSSVLAGIGLSVLPVAFHSVLFLWLASAGLLAGWAALRHLGSDPRPIA